MLTKPKNGNAKQIDERGRIMLGSEFAGSTMFVQAREDGSILLKPAVTVPAPEAWLWRNNRAMEMVLRGLEQARAGEITKGPDLKADEELIREMDEE